MILINICSILVVRMQSNAYSYQNECACTELYACTKWNIKEIFDKAQRQNLQKKRTNQALSEKNYTFQGERYWFLKILSHSFILDYIFFHSMMWRCTIELFQKKFLMPTVRLILAQNDLKRSTLKFRHHEKWVIIFGCNKYTFESEYLQKLYTVSIQRLSVIIKVLTYGVQGVMHICLGRRKRIEIR